MLEKEKKTIPNKPENHSKPETADDFYERNLQPLIQIFASGEENPEEYESNVLASLRELVERRQDLEGRSTASPMETMAEIREIFIDKAKLIIDDYSEQKNKGKTEEEEKISQSLLQKAKITLLAINDFSDWNKTAGKYHNVSEKKELEEVGEYPLNIYLGINVGVYEGTKLDSVKIKTLQAAGFENALKGMLNLYRENLSEIPDELLKNYLKDAGRIFTGMIADIIENKADRSGYSGETARLLAGQGHGLSVFKNINKFQLEKNDIEKIIERNDISYSHLGAILRGIEDYGDKLNNKDKNNLIAKAFRHNTISNLDEINEIKDEQEREKYLNLINKAKEINYYGGGISNEDGEEKKDSLELKQLIADGHLGIAKYGEIVTANRNIKVIAEKNYEWFLKTIKKYGQENMVLELLKPKDQERYLESLLIEGRQAEIKDLADNKDLHKHILSKGSFFDLYKNECRLNPDLFKDLDVDCFNLYKQKSLSDLPDSYSKNLFDDIGNFNLESVRGQKKYEDYLAYQELVTWIKSEFRKVSEAYEKFNLKIESFYSEDYLKEIKKEIYGGTKDDIPFLNGGKENILNKKKELMIKLDILKDNIPGTPADPNNTGDIILYKFGALVFDILNKDIENANEDSHNLKMIYNQRVARSRSSLNSNTLALTFSGETQYLDLLRGLGQPEKENTLNIIGRGKNLDSLLTNIIKINQGENLNSDILNALISDFGLNPERFISSDGFDRKTLLADLAQSFQENYLDYFSGLEGGATKNILSGKIKIKNDDLLIKIKEKYLDNSFNINQIIGEEEKDYNKNNWGEALTTYIRLLDENGWYYETAKKQLEELFSGPYKNECLGAMSEEWRSFLRDKEGEELPYKLELVSTIINTEGGAGNLSQIEALSNLMHAFKLTCKNERTNLETRMGVKDILSKTEERFSKDKWSNDDKTEFYHLSQEILVAAPSLFSSFAPLFEGMSGKEMKKFTDESLPLYQNRLIALQKSSNGWGKTTYDPRELVKIRTDIRTLITELNSNPTNREGVFQQNNERVAEQASQDFRERFGVLDIPGNLDKEERRLMQNLMRYTGNINKRDEKKEAIISLFLSLNLKKEWVAFRSGESVDILKHLTPEKAAILNDVMEGRENNRLPLETLGLNEEQKKLFQQELQAETISNMIGHIETIDIRLGNIKRNADDLLDPDIYDDPIDKKLVGILGENGRSVGSVLAKIYQELNGRQIVFSDFENGLREELGRALKINKWTIEDVKKTQERIQPISLINNFVSKLKDSNVEENITELNRRLQPNERIIKIFNRFDEGFKIESGAFAIGKDLEYLEALIVKNSDKVNAEERLEIDSYLYSIREKMSDLEKILDSSKEYFDKIKNSAHAGTTSEGNRLKERLAEMEESIYSKSDETMVISEMTNNLNQIIENMRQCLGCMKKEINNDTNLAFGDYNKFFLTSRKEKEKGSVADEIVFFAPTKNGSEEKMSFVLDLIYGTKSSDILVSHILTVYKKYKAIKNKFDDAKLSITIPHTTLLSAGLTGEVARDRLLEKIPDLKISFVAELVANIPTSSFSDNYIEFGGNGNGARGNGERTFSAFVIE